MRTAACELVGDARNPPHRQEAYMLATSHAGLKRGEIAP